MGGGGSPRHANPAGRYLSGLCAAGLGLCAAGWLVLTPFAFGYRGTSHGATPTDLATGSVLAAVCLVTLVAWDAAWRRALQACDGAASAAPEPDQVLTALRALLAQPAVAVGPDPSRRRASRIRHPGAQERHGTRQRHRGHRIEARRSRAADAGLRGRGDVVSKIALGGLLVMAATGAWLVAAPFVVRYQPAGAPWTGAAWMDVAVGAVVVVAGLAGLFAALAGRVSDLYAAAARGPEAGPGEAQQRQ